MPSSATITIVGAHGYIGSALARALQGGAVDLLTIGAGEPIPQMSLGTVVYCAGVTSEFRQRVADSVEAHAGLVSRIAEECNVERIIYLSSTRVYARIDSEMATEETPLTVVSSDISDVYNLSKLLGEAAVLGDHRPNLVVRLSNVYGPNFGSGVMLDELLTSAIRQGRVRLRSHPLSGRDYVALDDVIDLLVTMATSPCREGVYNVAYGENLSSGALAEAIADATGAALEMDPSAELEGYPTIRTSKARDEFGFRPRGLLGDLPQLVARYRAHFGTI